MKRLFAVIANSEGLEDESWLVSVFPEEEPARLFINILIDQQLRYRERKRNLDETDPEYYLFNLRRLNFELLDPAVSYMEDIQYSCVELPESLVNF